MHFNIYTNFGQDYSAFTQPSLWDRLKQRVPFLDREEQKESEAPPYQPICDIPWEDQSGSEDQRDPYILFRYLMEVQPLELANNI